MMFENTIFDEWLEDESKLTLEKIKSNEALTQDDKLIMILKSQSNHFHHLDIELREEVQTLRHEMAKGFEAADKRFEAFDKRFEASQETINKRFEAVQDTMNKRFEAVQDTMNKRFEASQKEVNHRFEASQESINKRFDALHAMIASQYTVMNNQIWKVMACVGFIVILGKLIERFPS